jgi:hypothetical protein
VSRARRVALTALIVVLALLLGGFTTTRFVKGIGRAYIEPGGEQIKRYHAVMEGHAGSPWQYRVLAPYLLTFALRALETLGVPANLTRAFVIFRTIQDSLILLLSYAYSRKLGLSVPASLLGMTVLAWGMSYSHYDSDLQFSTFFDVSFYLLAGLSILHGAFGWLVPIAALAALNRETSALIPFLLVAAIAFTRPPGSVRKAMPLFLVVLATYVVIFVGLRVLHESQPLLVAYGHPAGLPLLRFNVLRSVTWEQLLAVLGIVPVVAIMGYATWPRPVQAFFWVIVPIWFLVHAVASHMAETRAFLVPQAMVFIPGALSYLTRQARKAEPTAPPLPRGGQSGTAPGSPEHMT